MTTEKGLDRSGVCQVADLGVVIVVLVALAPSGQPYRV